MYYLYSVIFIIIIIIIILFLNKNNFSSKELVIKKLKECSITINGNKPQDIIVKNDAFYSMVLNEGDLGLAESYMANYWITKNLYQTLYYLIKNQDKLNSVMNLNIKDIFSYLNNYLFNQQKILDAELNVKKHYDIGNDLYTRMLDRNLQYTCAFFQGTDDLNIAQEQKMRLIGQKLNLKRGQIVLDIGCGWGGLVNYLSSTFDVKVVGITLSKEQIKYAQKRYGSNKNASFLFMDYRKIPKNMIFDRIVSVGMLEHVGDKNYDAYFKVVHDHLKQDGIALIHSIGCYSSSNLNDKFIQKYIFPGGVIPNFKQLSDVIPKYFQIQDWHNFGKYYAKTLKAWYKNINEKWHEIPQYNEKFRKMWNFYLLACAVVFDLCHLQLWQILITKSCIDLPKRDCLLKY